MGKRGGWTAHAEMVTCDMCLMCGHIAVWYFLQGKVQIPPTCGKKKQSRDEPATGGDMIPKRKKVKPKRAAIPRGNGQAI